MVFISIVGLIVSKQAPFVGICVFFISKIPVFLLNNLAVSRNLKLKKMQFLSKILPFDFF